MTRWDPRQWDFDIDQFLNPWVPHPPWRYLPSPVARFFGYRKHTVENVGNIVLVFWAFIAIFCGLAVIEVASEHIPSFEERGAPIIVGSFGAAAVLEFYAIESPLAQPRNAILGQLVSSVVGVGICKLFLLHPEFDSVRWIGGALACAAATAVMALTKTVHPPAGATALLAVVDDPVMNLGWFLIPVMMLGCSLMLAVALIFNNIQRRFPIYWWTPEDLRNHPRPWTRRPEPDEEGKGPSTSTDELEAPFREEATREVTRETARTGGRVVANDWTTEITIRPGEVAVPEHMYITPEEKLLLESLSNRLTG